jgi:putative transcriptional regulator
MATDAMRGRLLVATPALLDPNFARSVVLLLDHNDEGVVGLVLNRPSETSVAEVLPPWEDVATDPAVVFVGGPVTPDGAICLGRARVPDADAPQSFFGGAITTVDLSQGPDSLIAGTSVRVFAGYAGWGVEQLADEIASGSWYVVDGEIDDAFCLEPDELWRDVLKRQPGQLAMVANFPPDPSLN